MTNKNYLKGRRFEWKLQKQYEDLGLIVLRAAGSKGFADLVCIDPKEKHIVFVQCKAKRMGSVAKDSLRAKMYKKMGIEGFLRGNSFSVFCEVESA